MKPTAFASLAVAAAVLVALAAHPRAQNAPPFDRAAQTRDFMVLAGRGAEIGVQVIDGKEGVEVQEVRPNSPAEKAGLKKDDRLVMFDGERVRSVRQFSRLVQETPPGRTVKATILRAGKQQDVELTPAEGRGGAPGVFPNGDWYAGRLPDFDMFRNGMPFRFNFDGPASGRRLGVDVDPLTDQLAQYFGVTAGVLVRSVADGTPASRAGLKAGDVITSVDGQPTRTPDDLVRALRDAKDDEVTLAIVRDKKEITVRARLDAPRRTIRGARPA
jgi:S1-C subfamily serine protease